MGQTAWEAYEKKNERKGMFISLVLHSLLLLLFFFIVLGKPELDTNEGVLIDFGNSKTGLGDNNSPQPIVDNVKPLPVEEVFEEENTPIETESEPQVVEEVVTQNTEEAPVVKPKDEPKRDIEAEKKKLEEERKKREEIEKKRREEEIRKQAEAERERKEKEAQELKDKLDQAFKNTGSGGEGENEPGGDQGVKDGTPGAPKNPGDSSTGLGNSGVGYDLAGRKMVQKPTVNDELQKVGKVVIKITVDKQGRVVNAKYTTRGSTITDPYYIRISEAAALQAKFNSDPNAREEAFGTITFNYGFKN